MAALPAVDGEAVLGVIMADGTFDDLRQQLVTQLKKDVRRLCCALVLIVYQEVFFWTPCIETVQCTCVYRFYRHHGKRFGPATGRHSSQSKISPSRVLHALQAALLKYAEDAVAESRALRSSRSAVSKKELFDSVRRELECAPCLC